MPTLLRSCTLCGTPSTGSRCPRHQDNRTTAQRGYGTDHRRRSETMRPTAIGERCPLCLEPMLEGQALELDHTIPLQADPASNGDRIVHRHCNRARRDGGVYEPQTTSRDSGERFARNIG